MAEECGGKQARGFDPDGRIEKREDGEGDEGEDRVVQERALDIVGEDNRFPCFLVSKDVLEEDESEEEDEENVGDVFGQERQSEEDAGPVEIGEAVSFEEGEIGGERERREYPQEGVGIDDARHPEEDGRGADEDGRDQGFPSTKDALEEEIEDWQGEGGEKKYRETEGEIHREDVFLGSDGRAFPLDRFVFFGILKE